MNNTFFSLLDLLGIISFSISGAMVGIRQKLDMFGVMVIGMTTAVGGGITRDIILGILPPNAFVHPSNAIFAIATSFAVFLYVKYNKNPVTDRTFLKIYTLLDAIGLGVFTVIGINTAVGRGHADNLFLLVFLGTITGVGGGIIRDILVRRVPSVLRSDDLYATIAVIGSVFYVGLELSTLPTTISMSIAVTAITAVRMLSLFFRLRMPQANQQAGHQITQQNNKNDSPE